MPAAGRGCEWIEVMLTTKNEKQKTRNVIQGMNGNDYFLPAHIISTVLFDLSSPFAQHLHTCPVGS